MNYITQIRGGGKNLKKVSMKGNMHPGVLTYYYNLILCQNQCQNL